MIGQSRPLEITMRYSAHNRIIRQAINRITKRIYIHTHNYVPMAINPAIGHYGF
jgi:hypothetical protein